MRKFEDIWDLAAHRKGGESNLKELLTEPKSDTELAAISDDRYLAQMTRCIFNAGFHWRVITQKWAGFEEAFHGFDVAKLLPLSPEEWERYANDTRIVRNWQKIEAVWHNAFFVDEVSAEHDGFGSYIANWPETDQVGLMIELKKRGSRLGGNTAQFFLRFMGKSSFILSRDVVAALQGNGLDIKDSPNTQRELKLIQGAFNHWHEESRMPISHISRVLSYTAGDNIDVDALLRYRETQSVS